MQVVPMIVNTGAGTCGYNHCVELIDIKAFTNLTSKIFHIERKNIILLT